MFSVISTYMKLIISTLATLICSVAFAQSVFIYSPNERAGLHAAIKDANGQWSDLGQLCASDYSQWGAEKRMYSPYVLRASDGTWRAVWQVNDKAPTFAAAYSADLITWRPQDYPKMSAGPCKTPFIMKNGDAFTVYYTHNDAFRMTKASFDFRHFSVDEESDQSVFEVSPTFVEIDGKKLSGQLFNLTSDEYNALVSFHKQQKAEAEANSETFADDSVRFADIITKGYAEATLNVDNKNIKPISDKLIGIFFEDISYAADGGLYAEMVENRDFEYNGERKDWNATTAWHSDKPITIDTIRPISKVNCHYARLKSQTIENSGWDGMRVEQGAEYIFSAFLRAKDDSKVFVALKDGDEIIARGYVTMHSKLLNNWHHTELTLVAQKSATSAKLALEVDGEVDMDMISLFPTDTYKGRRNGLRRDIAEAIAALHPKFVRFPGGCMSHGQGIDNIYHWNETVGNLEDRKPDMNIWHYHQTRGLGFYEFFQWCEDMGAEPLPVLAAGVPCQNSAPNHENYGGQQGGIPMEQMDEYCQEILNLIEWANGDPNSSKWAKLRADAGHPKPFNLKYIGIGNEDLISTVFEERMLMIAKAVKAKYPDIVLCGTVGPFHYPSSDYIEGWRFANEHKDVIDMVDEHYYESPGWYLNNQHYYDNYDRNAPKVYLGEYSVQARSRRSTIESALCEAIHLCNVERNADVVMMTSYAPLLCNTLHRNWDPDMIYFRGNEAPQLTPSYHTQRLFGTYAGNAYVNNSIDATPEVSRRVVASVVKDSDGHTYVKVVNALPVSTRLKINGVNINNKTVTEGFCGSPTDRKASPSISDANAKGEYVELPPYSFQIFTVK